jgi:inward rectifier potassium channel
VLSPTNFNIKNYNISALNDRNTLNDENINEEIKDLGLSSKEITKGERLMNKNGTFNGRRVGLRFLESFNFYHYLVGLSWFKFMLIVVAGYVGLNFIFALVYYALGIESHLLGIIAHNEFDKFLEGFFFSFQSFTTVGYGRISPMGFWASSIAAFESLIGLLTLAIATGLFYGRFSRPVSRILYSKNALIAPFKDINGFMFRMANKQKSEMIDVEMRIAVSYLEIKNGTPARRFFNLELEYSKINFFPMTWTINHPIDKNSPLYGMTELQLKDSQAEFFILFQGFDDTFSQVVNSRTSYRYDEIVYGAKFVNIYGLDDDGRTIVELNKISDYEPAKSN